MIAAIYARKSTEQTTDKNICRSAFGPKADRLCDGRL
jgi:hypothetical protein